MDKIIFYSFGSLLIASALFVLLANNIIRSVFALFFTFFSIAALILFSGSDFLAISHLIVYIGGVLILLIFGVMLSNKNFLQTLSTNEELKFSKPRIIFILFAFILLSFFGINNLKTLGLNGGTFSEIQSNTSLEFIGFKYLSKYAFPFELISILLLLILIAVAFISRQKPKPNNDY